MTIMKTIWHKFKACINAIYGGRWYKRIAMWLLTLFVLFILFLGAVDHNLFGIFGPSPGIDDMHEAEHYNAEASEIYSADSVMLGRYFSENRSTVKYEEISPILIRTLVDTEDERFYSHWGIDFKGLFSAVKDITKGKTRGASTITQQLAKNLFVRLKKVDKGVSDYNEKGIPDYTDKGLLGGNIIIQKMKEWIIATKLEIVLTKRVCDGSTLMWERAGSRGVGLSYRRV